MNFRRLLVVIIITFSNQFILAQTIENKTNLPIVIPPSPNASSLGKFADQPVSTYSGTPVISIPIYSINVGDLKIPISLSYHAGGVKVNEIPSWTGLGWSLNSGGVITRSVHGNADESSTGYFNNASDIPFLNDCRTGNAAYSYCSEAAVTKNIDTQPDVFYYSFNGRSGKFVLNRQTRKVHVIPHNNLKIEYLDNNLNSWRITTEDGIVYLFDTAEESVSTAGPPVAYNSSWYLTSIKLPVGNRTISFEYDIENYSYDLPLSETSYHQIFYNTTGCSRKLYEQIRANLIINHARRISKIVFPGGSVEFIAGNYRYDFKGGKTLKQIRIKNESEVIKSYQLNYNYFTNNTENIEDDGYATINTEANTGKRLCLKNVQERNADNTASSQSYTFSYHQPYIVSGYLPDRITSTAQDHWGYYNGQVGNTSLIPSFIDRKSVLVPGALRHPVEEYAKIGTLTKIQYPTGGYTEYDYELNDAESNLLPDNINTFNASYSVGSCHILSTNNQFSIANQTASTTLVNIKLSGGPVPLSALNCNGNTAIPISSDQNSWIWFQIINISSPSNPFVAYTSSSQVTLGSSTGGTTSVNLPNGVYKIKAIKGNSNLSISATELSETYANMYGSFTFEVNGFYKETGSKKVGGLRVKKITNLDPVTTKKNIKIFNYQEAALSTGKVSYIPAYNYTFAEAFTCYGEGGAQQYAADYDVSTSFSQSPLTQMQGGFVGYSKVTVFEGEESTTGEIGTNGKTEFYYSNPLDMYSYYPSSGNNSVCFINSFVSDRSVFPFAPAISKDWKRGNLEKQIFYKKSGTAYIAVKETVNTYKDDYRGSENYYIPEVDVRAMKVGIRSTPRTTPLEDYQFEVQYYFIPSRYSKLIKTEEYEYNPLGQKTLVNNVSFEYENDEHLQLTKKTVSSGNGNQKVTKLYYPWDYKTTSPYDLMYENHIWDKLIQEDSYKESISAGNFLRSVRTEFGIWENNNNKILPTSVSTRTSNQASLENRIVFHSYDNDGNLLSVSKKEGPLTSYKWGYNSQYPIAEIKNASLGDFAYEDFEGNGLIGATPDVNPYSGKGGHSGEINLGNYYPALISKGCKLSYHIYDGVKWNHLETNYTGQTITGIIDNICIYPAGAIMTTYTYKPLVGMTSSTDARGETVLYEYDSFQRLKAIRDSSGNILKTYDYHYKP